MRCLPIIAALALSACATSAPGGDAAALRGCWIERRGDQTVTQRWLPDHDGWRGDELAYLPVGEPDRVRWKLKPGGDAATWSMCMVELNMMTSPPCWRAFFGAGRADGENTRWVEIDAGAEALKITYVTGEDRVLTYDGRRDGCDQAAASMRR